MSKFDDDGYLKLPRRVCPSCGGRLRVVRTKHKKPISKCRECGSSYESVYVDE